MNLRLSVIMLLMATLSGCNLQNAKFLTKNNYSGAGKLKNLYVIVVSDENTKDCMRYYQNFLTDSLKSYNVATEGTYHCCVDKKTNLNDVIYPLLPKNSTYEYALVVVVTKTVVGYGATSTRELQLDLIGQNEKEKLWSGKLSINFDWFISDENYRVVAKKMNTATVKELKAKEII